MLTSSNISWNPAQRRRAEAILAELRRRRGPAGIVAELPAPHPKQAAFVESPAKRKVIVAGRRGGKTTGAAIVAVKSMLAGRRVLEAAPTADQTSAFWDACKKYLVRAIAAGQVVKNETERRLEIRGGGRIRAKTAFDADSLRGDYADLLILDEYSLMKPSAWDEVGAPMLLDNDGDAVFIFTPQRKNHAHAAYVRALGDGTRWAAWHFTSHDNPHLSPGALAEITVDMTQDAYRQEILAEFLDNEGAVFRNISACLGAPLGAVYAQHNAHRLVIGADWGKHNDYTVQSVGCADCRVEVALHRVKGRDYTLLEDDTVRLVTDWRAGAILPERNAMGEPVIDRLLRRGVPVALGPDDKPGFMTMPGTKPALIENLALTFERSAWQFLPVPAATGELEAYERTVSPLTGRAQYSAPEGVHDDTVIARALMVWLAGRYVPLPERQPEKRSQWAEPSPSDDGRADWNRYR